MSAFMSAIGGKADMGSGLAAVAFWAHREVGTYAVVGGSLEMSTPKDIERRERKIDEALKETFPASDTPTFVGGVSTEQGEQPADKKRAARKR